MASGAWKQPFYVVRSALFLVRRRLLGFGPPGAPGLDEEALACFSELLAKATHYLEFGAGGTTLAAARAGVPTLTVEADPYFARAVRKALGDGSSVEILDIHLGLTREWTIPVFTRPSTARLARWRRYVEAPFERLDQRRFPDLILVDGRFRRACVLQAARKAALADAAATLMVDDYYLPGREHYAEVEQWLGTPRRVGRAAVFALTPGSAAPPEQAVERASADYR
jgi:hypothetical protein